MKGIVLAGGTGSRMLPLTKVTNKHLLPVYNKPMIFYPIETLKKMGIKEILIVSGKEHAGHIMNLLGSGQEEGVEYTYRVQDKAGGIAEALSLAKDFSNGENIAVILGDNIYEDTFNVSDFKDGARIFLKQVSEPQRFGVAELFDGKLIGIQEKPSIPRSNYAVTGLYIYDNSAFECINHLKPSARGELELTDVNNFFINKGKMEFRFVQGFWSDAGTFSSLFKATEFIKNKVDYVNHLD